MWIWRIAKRLFGPVVVRVIEYLFEEYAWWAVVVAGVSAVIAYLTGQGWVFWFLVVTLLFSLYMAIRQTWFPCGFRKKKPDPKIEPLKVIPTKYGNRGPEEGLFIKNISSDPVYEVIAAPLAIGHLTVFWQGPEVAVLEAGQECFFYPETKGEPYRPPSPHMSGLFASLRSWQLAIDDWSAEVEGVIQYEDATRSPHETQYRIGPDVLNEDCGLVVKVVRPTHAKDEEK